jgi:hypothetical protein
MIRAMSRAVPLMPVRDHHAAVRALEGHRLAGRQRVTARDALEAFRDARRVAVALELERIGIGLHIGGAHLAEVHRLAFHHVRRGGALVGKRRARLALRIERGGIAWGHGVLGIVRGQDRGTKTVEVFAAVDMLRRVE